MDYTNNIVISSLGTLPGISVCYYIPISYGIIFLIYA